MAKSNFKTIHNFFDLLLEDRYINKAKSHLAFVILENKSIPWTWYKEKMTQYLFWNMQGGVTGAGSGHKIYFYDNVQKALEETKAMGHTHAMVCNIGMLISGFGNQVTNKTPVQNFYEFSETDEYMRAHIIAHSNKEATLHLQHFEINLNKWNGKDITDLGTEYKRSKEDIHDDYTPLWIQSPNHPRINNFTKEQRSEKNYLYPHRDYEKHEQIFYDFLNLGLHKNVPYDHSSSSLLIHHASRKRKRYYYENNEELPENLEGLYDVIICPTSGILGEFLYDRYSHEKTKVILFDYDSKFLEVKQKIIDFGLAGDDLLMYMKHLSDTNDSNEYIFSASRTPNQFKAFKANSDKTEQINAVRMIDNLSQADYELKLVNMLNDDFDWMIDIIKDKRVLCYTSNIFKYYITWLYCDTNVIVNQYNKLIYVLENSSDYTYFGRSWK